MKCYEIFMKIVNNGKTVTKTVLFITAVNAFDAIAVADKNIENDYGVNAYGHILKINSIDEESYQEIKVA